MCQVIYTSVELAREVQRITVDASANISEVQQITLVSLDPSSLTGSFALRHGYYVSPPVPYNASADEVRSENAGSAYCQLMHEQSLQKAHQCLHSAPRKPNNKKIIRMTFGLMVR